MAQKPDRTEEGSWLRSRCYACGHRLSLEATACPQCGQQFDGRVMPNPAPDRCLCQRCIEARK